ncbi:MAG: lipid-A-disaccharide synthase [Burkholderiaceae bacterium]
MSSPLPAMAASEAGATGLPARSQIAFLAGEASGDLLASLVLPELARRSPADELVGIGGDRMMAAGLVPWHHSRELAVRGYVEVLRHLPRLFALRRSLAQRLTAQPPRAFVGVDAPDFNLGLELKLRAAGIPTVHFVSPSIWAWRPERIDTVRRAVDHMLLIFPFEQKIYDDAGLRSTYIGHPLARVIPMVPDESAARARLGIAPHGSLVAILPGSRADEVRWCGPAFFAAAEQMLATDASLKFLVPAADAERRAQIDALLAIHPKLAAASTLTDGRSHDVLEAADAVLVASGTATLEAALYKKPMVISYLMPRFSAWIMRRKGLIPWVGLPNILAGEFLVPELLQQDATPERIARAMLDQLDAGRRAQLVERFSAMHESLTRDTPALAAEAILATAR